MALFINGVGQDSFNMNGVSIDNLYVDDVLVWSLGDIIAPDAPTNFLASDDKYEQITFTWDNSTIGTPTPTYDIHEFLGSVIATNVTSPHTEPIPGFSGNSTYFVQAVNSAGFADSNTDNGSSLISYVPPVYLMTEDLDNGELYNSSQSGDKFNGIFSGAVTYNKDGTVELGNESINTQWNPPLDEEWSMTGIYNVVKGSSYDMYTIHYKTGNLCDIYLGSNTETMALSESDKPYTPPTEAWGITEDPPSIIFGELVPNPNFDTNIDGVVSIDGAAISWQAPGYWRTVTTAGPSRIAEYPMADILEIGVEYTVDCVLAGTGSSTSYFSLRTEDGSSAYVDMVTEGSYVGGGDFVATGKSCLFRVNSGGSINSTLDIDSVTIKRKVV